MERLEQALPSPKRPPPAPSGARRPDALPMLDRRGASTADRLLVASALLLVVAAAGLASAGRYEALFLILFGVGVALTVLARVLLAAETRARSKPVDEISRGTRARRR